jgi:hypothetical protein
MQPGVDQCVDDDRVRPGRQPALAGGIGSEQEVRQEHARDLRADAADLGQGLDDAGGQSTSALIPEAGPVGRCEALVDPCDEVATGDVPHEQHQGGCPDRERALPGWNERDGAAAEVAGLGAGPVSPSVAATVEGPVAAEARTRRAPPEVAKDRVMARAAGASLIGKGGAVADPLQRQRGKEAVNQRRCVMRLDRSSET